MSALEKVEAALERMTPGEWSHAPYVGHVSAGKRLVASCNGYQSNIDGEKVDAENHANAEAICTLRNESPALAAECRALRGALTDLVRACDNEMDPEDQRWFARQPGSKWRDAREHARTLINPEPTP